ncbi:MAG: hypothetical protein ILO36_09180 [Abditibacteriota bacterium]|nr:hypothetical protein [Abditibacteriota bacterium]
MNVILLLVCLLMGGVYFSSLKPVEDRCRSISELQLFTACFSLLACIGSVIPPLVTGGSLYIPFSGFCTAVCFGLFFSLCVFTNLKALSEGPLSLTSLIVNFSLVFPVIHAFIFLREDVTVNRIIGISLFVVCMLIFSNPKLSGEKKMTAAWFWIAFFSMVCNGILAVMGKVYAMATDNAYASAFLGLGYFFSVIVSLIIFAALRRTEKPEGFTFKGFFTPSMYGFILLAGASNFIMNYIVVLLATRMDGSIVYPVVMGGGPVVATIAARVVFGEELNPKKITGILLGVLAIVLLNL